MNLDAHVDERDYNAFPYPMAAEDLRADLNTNGAVKADVVTWEDRSRWDGADQTVPLGV